MCSSRRGSQVSTRIASSASEHMANTLRAGPARHAVVLDEEAAELLGEGRARVAPGEADMWRRALADRAAGQAVEDRAAVGAQDRDARARRLDADAHVGERHLHRAGRAA